jgi:hypothetical protein
MLTTYQKTDLFISPLIFLIIYFLYLKFTKESYEIWDILWCTISLFLIIYIKDYIMNYYMIINSN